MILQLLLVRPHSAVALWIPGLFLLGAGVGVMLTSSVNVVQSSFPESEQGDISGLSRSISNLGSSLGTALVGSILVARAAEAPYASSFIMMLIFTGIGLVLAVLIPRRPAATAAPSPGAPSPATQQAGR
jgi:MFS family permease